MKRAEERLFSREAPVSAEDPPRPGRVLETVVASPTPPLESEATEAPRKRGRPPSAVNRSADPQSPPVKRGRGRPRANPEVRQVQLTPEVVSAAMETISRIATDPIVAGGETVMARRRGFEETTTPVLKRPRGRPRRRVENDGQAGLTAGGLAPSFDGPPSADSLKIANFALSRLRRAGASPDSGLDILTRSDVRRLFKPRDQWRPRMRLRAIARRKKAATVQR